MCNTARLAEKSTGRQEKEATKSGNCIFWHSGSCWKRLFCQFLHGCHEDLQTFYQTDVPVIVFLAKNLAELMKVFVILVQHSDNVNN